MPVDLDATSKMSSTKINEILNLLQEECGEVVVAVSKFRRFGEEHNKKNLVQELGDVRLLIELLQAQCFVSEKELLEAQKRKEMKLMEFSSVYES